MSVPNGSLPTDDTVTALTEIKELFPKNDSEKIKTSEFLDGSRGLVALIGKFGKVFAPVVYDMNRNIEKINDKFQKDIDKFEYIEDFILLQKEKDNFRVIDALQWLRRALHFILKLFQYVIDKSDVDSLPTDLAPALKRAYSETLEQYHGWLGTQLFNVMSRFAPSTHSFFFILSLNNYNKTEFVLRDLRLITERLGNCVEKLKLFYEENNLETYYRA